MAGRGRPKGGSNGVFKAYCLWCKNLTANKGMVCANCLNSHLGKLRLNRKLGKERH